MELDQDVPTHNELDRVRTLVLVEGVRLELGLKLPGLSGGNEHPEVPLVDFSIRLKHAFLFLVRVLKFKKSFIRGRHLKLTPYWSSSRTHCRLVAHTVCCITLAGTYPQNGTRNAL